MGCVPSSQVPKKAPSEPIPDYKTLLSTPAKTFPKEPFLSPDLVTTEGVTFRMNQVATHANGDTYEIGTVDLHNDTKEDTQQCNCDYVIGPTKDWGGHEIHRSMDDLVAIQRVSDNTVFGYCLRDAEAGVNCFRIVTLVKYSEKQQPFKNVTAPGKLPLYTFAYLEFDYHSTVGSIFLLGQSRASEPIYTVRRCSEFVWTVKKLGVPVIQLVQCPRGLMPKFTSWKVYVSPQMDLAFAMALANICAYFRITLKKQMIQYYG
jgi:hypothetical protein